MNITIEQRRAVDYERFQAYEWERRVTDEITDASERIALPMRNEFEYQLGSDGHLWFQGENIGDLLDKTIKLNEQVVLAQPHFMTELIRNRIERDEYDQQRRLALGTGDDPDTLVVLSPIPDAVVRGLDLGAYDTRRMKMLVRIYTRSETGITATSLSLDRSDRQGMEAIARQFGCTIPEEATSEDILAMRLWGDSRAYEDDIVAKIRRTYDAELTKQHGGVWHAGRQDGKVIDARMFVMMQHDLLAEHLAIIRDINAADNGNVRTMLKEARYNFAAALTRRLRGDADAASLSDAGAIAQNNGEQYNGDCPTGTSASQSLAELGLRRREWKKGSCRTCQDVYNPSGIVGECDVCRYCENADNHGKLQDTIQRAQTIKASQARTLQHVEQADVPKQLSKQDMIIRKYGKYARINSELTVGGMLEAVYDTRTNEVIASA